MQERCAVGRAPARLARDTRRRRRVGSNRRAPPARTMPTCRPVARRSTATVRSRPDRRLVRAEAQTCRRTAGHRSPRRCVPPPPIRRRGATLRAGGSPSAFRCAGLRPSRPQRHRSPATAAPPGAGPPAARRRARRRRQARSGWRSGRVPAGPPARHALHRRPRSQGSSTSAASPTPDGRSPRCRRSAARRTARGTWRGRRRCSRSATPLDGRCAGWRARWRDQGRDAAASPPGAPPSGRSRRPSPSRHLRTARARAACRPHGRSRTRSASRRCPGSRSTPRRHSRRACGADSRPVHALTVHGGSASVRRPVSGRTRSSGRTRAVPGSATIVARSPAHHHTNPSTIRFCCYHDGARRRTCAPHSRFAATTSRRKALSSPAGSSATNSTPSRRRRHPRPLRARGLRGEECPGPRVLRPRPCRGARRARRPRRCHCDVGATCGGRVGSGLWPHRHPRRHAAGRPRRQPARRRRCRSDHDVGAVGAVPLRRPPLEAEHRRSRRARDPAPRRYRRRAGRRPQSRRRSSGRPSSPAAWIWPAIS